MPKYYKKQDEKEEVEVSTPTPEPMDEIKPEEETVEIEVEKKEEEKPVKSDSLGVKYREVVYLGVANEAERFGAVTGNSYIFRKDNYRMPEATQVDERDYPGLISEKGKGCARRDASILFMSKLDWNLEIEQARIANSA